MNIASMLFNSLVDVPINDGEADTVQMTGPQIVQDSHVEDLLNLTSAASTGVYLTKSLFKDHLPYSIEDNATTVVLHNHFLREVRRQLSGVTTDSKFGPAEQEVYDNYVLELNGEVYDTAMQAVLDAIDFWLIEEVQEHTHRSVDRTYDESHPWMKIQTR